MPPSGPGCSLEGIFPRQGLNGPPPASHPTAPTEKHARHLLLRFRAGLHPRPANPSSASPPFRAPAGHATALAPPPQVVVAYYRAGYTPRDYEAAEGPCWAARLKVERSTAIKCPSIGYHLAGTKKVQQALFDQQQLARCAPPPVPARIVGRVRIRGERCRWFLTNKAHVDTC